MNNEIQSYIAKYGNDIQNLFTKLRKLIIQSVPCEIEEKMWAKLPSYYLGDKYIRIIPFKDHINIEAKAIMEHDEQLKQFKITPKGMLQIYLNQDIPENILISIFNKSLIELN
jgi:predicted PilT family ATPase